MARPIRPTARRIRPTNFSLVPDSSLPVPDSSLFRLSECGFASAFRLLNGEPMCSQMEPAPETPVPSEPPILENRSCIALSRTPPLTVPQAAVCTGRSQYLPPAPCVVA